MASRLRQLLLIMSIVIFTLFFSLSKGSISIPLEQILFDDISQFHSIFYQIRLPRTLSAFVSGGLLALAGSLIQLLLNNPLADPYILGISSGAALVTLTMMLWGLSQYWLVAGAWMGSSLIIFLIFLLAKKHQWHPHTLLLSGIAIACGSSALVSFILVISPNTTLHSMLFWLTGDLNGARFPWFELSILILACFICYLLSPGLNMLYRNEKEAQVLGLACKRYRIILYLLTSLLTACAVTLAGCIGFIGLIIPHLTRLLVGYDHRMMLPVAVLLGGSFLTFTDTMARTLFAPQQLPVGILMAFIGVPIFIYILTKHA